MRPITINKGLTIADDDAIALVQGLTAAGDLVLNGALGSGYPADLEGLAVDQTFEAGVPLTLVGPYGLPARIIGLFSSDNLAGGAADTNGMALVQAIDSPNPLALETAFAGMPRQITLTSIDDLTGVDFAIVGLDETGSAAGETIAGPGAGLTVAFAGLYSVVTSITPDAAGSETVEAGWATYNGAEFLVDGVSGGANVSNTVAGNAATLMEYSSVSSILPIYSGGALEISAGWGAVSAPFGIRLDTQRLLSIDASGDVSGVFFTIYGTNQAGQNIQETLQGPSSATSVETTLNFLTVSRIYGSASTGAQTVAVGTWDTGDSSPIPLDIYLTPFNVTLQATVSAGTPSDYSVEYTLDDIWAPGYVSETGNWVPITGMANVSADAIATIISPVTALRLALESDDDGMQLRIVQAGVR